MRRGRPAERHSEAGQGRAEGLTLSPEFTARLYSLLRKRFGHRHWWPADSPFEVAVGAILTQQTTWGNVEKAMSNLKGAGALSVEGICGLGTARLERLIRPSGYFRQKAARLRGFCVSVRGSYGSVEAMSSAPAGELADYLMSVRGIGKETRDSIMLYAAGKRAFVIDAYTRRIVARLLGLGEEPGYDELQAAFEGSAGTGVALYKDMHAQFVELGKRHCRKTGPLCAGCPALPMCSYGRRGAPA